MKIVCDNDEERKWVNSFLQELKSAHAVHFTSSRSPFVLEGWSDEGFGFVSSEIKRGDDLFLYEVFPGISYLVSRLDKGELLIE